MFSASCDDIEESFCCLAGGDDEASEGMMSSEGPVVFELIKDASELAQKRVSGAAETNLTHRKKTASSQLRRRPVSTRTGRCQYHSLYFTIHENVSCEYAPSNFTNFTFILREFDSSLLL